MRPTPDFDHRTKFIQSQKLAMPSQRQQVYTRDLNKKEPLKQRDTQIVEYEHFQVVEHLVRTDPQL